MVVRDSAHILLEGSPAGFDADTVAADLWLPVPASSTVRHVHAWSITENAADGHSRRGARPGVDRERPGGAVKSRLAGRFGFGHATVEIHPAER